MPRPPQSLAMLVLFPLLWTALAAEKPGPRPAAPSSPEKNGLVPICAVVTDRDGRPVDGLTREDFLLLEDGVPQSLESFSREYLGKEAGAIGQSTGTASAPAASRRVVALVVDTMHISSSAVEVVRNALRQFLGEQKGSQDLVSIVTTTGKPGNKCPFTGDLKVLEAAIQEVRPGKTEHESFLSPALCGKALRGDPQSRSLAEVLLDSETQFSGSIMVPRTGSGQMEVLSKCRMILLEAATRRRVVTNVLGNTIERMAALPGQHLLALCTEGFSATATGGEIAVDDLHPVIAAAGRSGVMIYAFEAKAALSSKAVNVEAYSLTSALQDAKRDLQHGMALLAGQTGGEVFFNLEGIGSQLQAMMDHNLLYYRLVYSPPAGKDPRKFRSVQIALKGRPDCRVRAPKTFFTAPIAWSR